MMFLALSSHLVCEQLQSSYFRTIRCPVQDALLDTDNFLGYNIPMIHMYYIEICIKYMLIYEQCFTISLDF